MAHSFLVLQISDHCIHDARLYGFVLWSYSVAAVCALPAMFFRPHVVQVCCLIWPWFVMWGNGENRIVTNACQKSHERLKNLPFWHFIYHFWHCHPLLNCAQKLPFPWFLGGPDPPPPVAYYCQVKMPPLFYRL